MTILCWSTLWIKISNYFLTAVGLTSGGIKLYTGTFKELQYCESKTQRSYNCRSLQQSTKSFYKINHRHTGQLGRCCRKTLDLWSVSVVESHKYSICGVKKRMITRLIEKKTQGIWYSCNHHRRSQRSTTLPYPESPILLSMRNAAGTHGDYTNRFLWRTPLKCRKRKSGQQRHRLCEPS